LSIALSGLLRHFESDRLAGLPLAHGCAIDRVTMRSNVDLPAEERVAADARDHGARSLFIVDDNITLNVRRFEALCRAIIDAGLNNLEYTVQAMTSAIASHGERLARLMREAGFRYVFLGIENIFEEDLQFLRAESKNRARENGRKSGNATLKAIDHLHRNKMIVVGGVIVGSPGDTRESVEANLEFARRYVDWPYIQHPTPYPGTPMTKDFRDRGLIINERLEEYDGTFWRPSANLAECSNGPRGRPPMALCKRLRPPPNGQLAGLS
jgi:radical SAM superfamily enzyme YgiQ (UPF0313 family)